LIASDDSERSDQAAAMRSVVRGLTTRALVLVDPEAAFGPSKLDGGPRGRKED
jgi:hypothetical protein